MYSALAQWLEDTRGPRASMHSLVVGALGSPCLLCITQHSYYCCVFPYIVSPRLIPRGQRPEMATIFCMPCNCHSVLSVVNELLNWSYQCNIWYCGHCPLDITFSRKADQSLLHGLPQYCTTAGCGPGGTPVAGFSSCLTHYGTRLTTVVTFTPL